MNVRRYNENDGAGKRRLLSVCTSWRSVPSSVLLDTRNSLSNSPCPLGSARGRGRYNLLARAINNKPFQCSDRRKSPQRRCSAARVEQGDLFNFYARSRSLISDAVGGTAARLRGSACAGRTRPPETGALKWTRKSRFGFKFKPSDSQVWPDGLLCIIAANRHSFRAWPRTGPP